MHNALLSQSSSSIASVLILRHCNLFVHLWAPLDRTDPYFNAHLSSLIPRLPDLFSGFQHSSLKSWERSYTILYGWAIWLYGYMAFCMTCTCTYVHVVLWIKEVSLFLRYIQSLWDGFICNWNHGMHSIPNYIYMYLILSGIQLRSFHFMKAMCNIIQ